METPTKSAGVTEKFHVAMGDVVATPGWNRLEGGSLARAHPGHAGSGVGDLVLARVRDIVPQGVNPVLLHAHPRVREAISFHKAMSSLLSAPGWWNMPEGKMLAVVGAATGGGANVAYALAEFRKMRADRGLPEVSEKSLLHDATRGLEALLAKGPVPEETLARVLEATRQFRNALEDPAMDERQYGLQYDNVFRDDICAPLSGLPETTPEEAMFRYELNAHLAREMGVRVRTHMAQADAEVKRRNADDIRGLDDI